MRIVSAVTGALIIALGATAVVTGDFAVAGVWVLALALAAVGLAGLLAAVTAVSR